MSFLDIVFPVGIAYGITGGPTFNTDVVEFFNGREKRNANRENGLLEWDASHGLKEQSEMDVLIAFFREVRGQAHGFKFRDWTDFTMTGQLIGTGDGATTTFDVVKTYGSTNTESRRLYKLDDGSHDEIIQAWKVYLNDVEQGSGFTIDYENGQVTFGTPPAGGVTVKVDGQFWVPARFGTDRMRVRLEDHNVLSWGEIPIFEIIPPFPA